MRLKTWLKKKLAGRVVFRVSEVSASDGGYLGSLKNPALYFKADEHPPLKEQGDEMLLTPWGYRWLFGNLPDDEGLAI